MFLGPFGILKNTFDFFSIIVGLDDQGPKPTAADYDSEIKLK